MPELTSAGPDEHGYRIGAVVRQRAVEHDPAAREDPLIGMALPFVGHRELRSAGRDGMRPVPGGQVVAAGAGQTKRSSAV